jgi:hypothetical protein
MTLKVDHLCRFVIRPEAARRHGSVGGLIGTKIALIWAAAYCRSVHSGQFGAQMPTRPPSSVPSRSSPAGQGQHVAVQFRMGPAPSSGRANEQAQRAYACGMALSLDLAPVESLPARNRLFRAAQPPRDDPPRVGQSRQG